ncbi:VacJ family lipoprotein [Actibacterium sp. 188UL27-1]|uniref:MlaA family lipoprotein n=1 Tax=Actibacterium sp. 188UL27-1 TaxID=2786961 RepID=UPI00195E6D91|nr:VacJ family lipoprotein [Actibacterium sp. 188UL27-1]MBM7066017.1 VacJ family lipoprotein [Actibacterium sp. 188UL27-1]
MATAIVLLTGACANPPVSSGSVYDPLEARNRKVHNFNRKVDQKVLRPVSKRYGGAVGPAQLFVSNFASNLDQPGLVINDLLQGRIEDAAHNTFRFFVNGIFGLAGVLDPATEMGLEKRDTDFGETLHVWGSGEGRYLELPFLGPSTERDTLGIVVDAALNPIRSLGSDDFQITANVAGASSTVGDRFQFSDTVDSILYESADSYAQARLLYLQNRRFELGGQASEDEAFDPFEEFDVE